MKTTLLTGSALALATVLALTACGGSAQSSPEATKATCPNGEIKFGIEPYEDPPAKLKPAYDVLAAALSKKLECPVSVQVVEDYAAEVLAMRNGKLDLGQFGPPLATCSRTPRPAPSRWFPSAPPRRNSAPTPRGGSGFPRTAPSRPLVT